MAGVWRQTEPAMTGHHSDLLCTAKQSRTFLCYWTIIALFINRLYVQKLWNLTRSWCLLFRSSTPFKRRQSNIKTSRCFWRYALQSVGISSSTLKSHGPALPLCSKDVERSHRTNQCLKSFQVLWPLVKAWTGIWRQIQWLWKIWAQCNI